METCSLTQSSRQGRIYLEDHLLLFVLSGIYTINLGKQQITVKKNQMVLIKKGVVIEYNKIGDLDYNNTLDYWMFFLKDDLLKHFAKMINIKPGEYKQLVTINVQPMNERLLKYLESIKSYFNENESIDNNLIKLKLLELLYDLAAIDNNFIQQLLQFKPPSSTNITKVLEENIMNPVSLKDLAYLSGRSLSSFKRDFYAIYQVPPAQWIRERKITKAKELLASTSLSITDICFMTGFENLAHFSRIFKKITGSSPTFYRKKTNYEL
ncbi:helix-turn-helix domain-containing protein [Clostridium sp. YIM B02565]|uniref:Helix-turn-helix domain-containing protein n=2 Tax=Clostridium paridis TaxID=2803863 RepID=A0A937FGI5_9CLOT|nr:helix-turn-helix domain-containing protein [Clostridium paridis]